MPTHGCALQLDGGRTSDTQVLRRIAGITDGKVWDNGMLRALAARCSPLVVACQFVTIASDLELQNEFQNLSSAIEPQHALISRGAGSSGEVSEKTCCGLCLCSRQFLCSGLGLIRSSSLDSGAPGGL